MKHYECKHFLALDCEKGMCAVSRMIVPLDGEGSDACPNFECGKLCKFCVKFHDADAHGIGTCSGFEKESWAYGDCGAFCCENFENA